MTMKPGGEARPMIDIILQTELNRNEHKRYPVVKRPFQPNFKGIIVLAKIHTHGDPSGRNIN